jgi:multidrug efflux pump subunit AcrA (membrane-fusion protein)
MQRENDIANALETINKFTIYSPGDGIFQIEVNRSTGQQIRLGDEVYRGYLLARIPDIRMMKVMSYVNEVDIRKVKAGMKVIVSLDAMPHVPFRGVITSIDRICTQREQEKVFRTEIEILDSDLSLKPGMSVSCEYICYESDDDMFVPNSCLHQENGQSYVFVKRGGSVKRVGVVPGPSNANHTVISGDVTPGQQLVLYEWIAGTLNQ